MAPAVRQGDSQWADIVRWTQFAMINAEELGVTSKNVEDMRANSKDPNIRRMLGVEGNLHEGLSRPGRWTSLPAIGPTGLCGLPPE